jgi:hypothetical protein
LRVNAYNFSFNTKCSVNKERTISTLVQIPFL